MHTALPSKPTGSTHSKSDSLQILAPAKVNLFFHICGKRKDGMHLLDSWVAFTDFGDYLIFEPADRFGFSITGPNAHLFSDPEKDPGNQSENLVVRAAYALAQIAKKQMNVKITLHKHLPLEAGIGGGSSDAAACLRGLCQWWDIDPFHNPATQKIMDTIMLNLGADVPICMYNQPAQVQGIGDIIHPFPHFPSIPVVLIFPNAPCSTKDVFSHFHGSTHNPYRIPTVPKDIDTLVTCLKGHVNDLQDAAKQIAPEIEQTLDVLARQQGILHYGMSGSGSTCYGLFQSDQHAHKVIETIRNFAPEWWAKAGRINGI